MASDPVGRLILRPPYGLKELIMDLDFPLWLRATHLFNFVLLGILIRSGWEILASLPRLWWRNDSKPGTEWMRFTRRKLPQEEGVYTSLMDERSMSPLLALPGRENIGLGRHWHGLGVILWVLNGLEIGRAECRERGRLAET